MMRGFSCGVILICAASTQGQVTFEDVTSISGLNYIHWDPDPSGDLYCRSEPRMVGGAAAGDFDGDGWVDLYVTRILQPNMLWRNVGGVFVDVAATAGVDIVDESSGCAWADIDNDGDLDLYVASMADGGRNYLFINNGGVFSEEAVARGADVPCATCRHNIMSVTFGDYDLDGDLDLHTTEWWSTDPLNTLNRLLRNDGTGFFEDVTESAGATLNDVWGFASGFADIDDDGWPDLLVAADFLTSRMLRNLGNGQFEDITISAAVGTDENGMGSAIGDIDNDGDLDWFVTSIYDPSSTCESAPCGWGYSGNRLYINNGTGTFLDRTDLRGVRDGAWGWGTSFFDYDNDGDLDLGMTNGVVFPCSGHETSFHDDGLRLWRNDGLTMTEVAAATQFTDTGSGKGFVVFDYDKDGDLDVFITNNAAGPVLLRNNGGNANPWLRVRLQGIDQPQGVGARIFLQTVDGGDTQRRDVNCNNNFMSQNELVAHFGLGPGVSSVYRVTIEWPTSGETQIIENVPVNQEIVISESQVVPAASTRTMLAFVVILIASGSRVIRRHHSAQE